MKYKIRQVICLLLGLFILAFGIALSTKSGLGVGPTSSLPYVLSRLVPLSMGTLTMIMNVIFAVLQILILRKNYKLVYLLQLVVVFFFSFFTDFTLKIVENWKADTYPMQLVYCIGSCIIMAIGVFFEVRAGLITMATEGLINAISKVFKIDFGTMKMIFDWGMVVISAVISLLAWHQLIGIREGTVIAAFLVGYIVRIFNKHFTFIYEFLGTQQPAAQNLAIEIDEKTAPLVITIEREWGSGGHEIGEKIAKRLGIPFYDYAVISKTAEATGLAPEMIQKKEQKIGLVYSIYNQSYAGTQNVSAQDQIFEAQRKVISDFAASGSCVIVGRLGSYVLKDRPNSFHLFVTAKPEFRNQRIAKQMKIGVEQADDLRKKEDIGRRHHCRHFTGEPWGMAMHYAMTLDSSEYGVDHAVELVLDALNKREEFGQNCQTNN